MNVRPTIRVTNWASRALHGPGRKLTIMCMPRAWEHGDGRVPACTPLLGWFNALRRGDMGMDEYEAKIRERLAEHEIAPGDLVAITGGDSVPVVDGDTLCCACARDVAGRRECHRVWASEALSKAGWRVLLDGVEVLP